MRPLATYKVLALVCLASPACATPAEEHRAEVRRQLLDAEKQSQERGRILDAQRVTNSNGELLPSNNQVAGITLPRGFEPKFVFEHEWHYDGQLPLKKLENYFVSRLEATVERPDPYSIVFARARTKGDAAMNLVTITILPVPGRDDWSRIHIVEARPLPKTFPTATEIEAELAARHRNMN